MVREWNHLATSSKTSAPQGPSLLLRMNSKNSQSRSEETKRSASTRQRSPSPALFLAPPEKAQVPLFKRGGTSASSASSTSESTQKKKKSSANRNRKEDDDDGDGEEEGGSRNEQKRKQNRSDALTKIKNAPESTQRIPALDQATKEKMLERLRAPPKSKVDATRSSSTERSTSGSRRTQKPDLKSSSNTDQPSALNEPSDDEEEDSEEDEERHASRGVRVRGTRLRSGSYAMRRMRLRRSPSKTGKRVKSTEKRAVSPPSTSQHHSSSSKVVKPQRDAVSHSDRKEVDTFSVLVSSTSSSDYESIFRRRPLPSLSTLKPQLGDQKSIDAFLNSDDEAVRKFMASRRAEKKARQVEVPDKSKGTGGSTAPNSSTPSKKAQTNSSNGKETNKTASPKTAKKIQIILTPTDSDDDAIASYIQAHKSRPSPVSNGGVNGGRSGKLPNSVPTFAGIRVDDLESSSADDASIRNAFRMGRYRGQADLVSSFRTADELEEEPIKPDGRVPPSEQHTHRPSTSGNRSGKQPETVRSPLSSAGERKNKSNEPMVYANFSLSSFDSTQQDATANDTPQRNESSGMMMMTPEHAHVTAQKVFADRSKKCAKADVQPEFKVATDRATSELLSKFYFNYEDPVRNPKPAPSPLATSSSPYAVRRPYDSPTYAYQDASAAIESPHTRMIPSTSYRLHENRGILSSAYANMSDVYQRSSVEPVQRVEPPPQPASPSVKMFYYREYAANAATVPTVFSEASEARTRNNRSIAFTDTSYDENDTRRRQNSAPVEYVPSRSPNTVHEYSSRKTSTPASAAKRVHSVYKSDTRGEKELEEEFKFQEKEERERRVAWNSHPTRSMWNTPARDTTRANLSFTRVQNTLPPPTYSSNGDETSEEYDESADEWSAPPPPQPPQRTTTTTHKTKRLHPSNVVHSGFDAGFGVTTSFSHFSPAQRKESNGKKNSKTMNGYSPMESIQSLRKRMISAKSYDDDDDEGYYYDDSDAQELAMEGEEEEMDNNDDDINHSYDTQSETSRVTEGLSSEEMKFGIITD